MIKKTYNKIKKVKSLFFPSVYTKLREYYAENYEERTINENLIVYETRDGSSIVDSPYAMFNYLISSPEYAQYSHIWIVDSLDSDGLKLFSTIDSNKVKFVERNTIEYVDALLEAKYLINNSTFDSFFTKRPGQVYINTWHGTPLKHMGFDIPGKVSHSQNVLRNFLMTDYLLSPNSHTTQIFSKSYKLEGIYPGKILESGYPRIDLTLKTSKEEAFNKMEIFGVSLNKALPTILYCPTWKGSGVQNVNDDLDQINKEITEIRKVFSKEYNVILKVHPFLYKTAVEDERLVEFLVSDFIDANEVLSVTDILVTDYSSIFFDFLVTNKPIVFYAWDKDLYEENRGMYLEDTELPGPTAENIQELIKILQNIDTIQKEYQIPYQQLAKRMTSYDDGNATKRYVDYIFKDIENSNMNVVKLDSSKIKLLIFPGGMRNNGITTSFLNLVDNIDYEKYDVTIISNVDREKEMSSNFSVMNSNVRPLFRFGGEIFTKKEKILNKKLANKGLPKDQRHLYPEVAYKREMRRLTSGLSFDVSIDFSGYSYFWGRHILSASAKKYVAFMHNDLMADSQREINGVKPMFKDLNGLFSIYFKFDKLLSVSPMTRDVNLKKLSNFVTSDQMSYVVNTINIDKILNSRKEVLKKNEKLVISKNYLMIEEEKSIPLYKNLPDIKKDVSFFKDLEPNDKIVTHALYILNEIKFVKVSINDEYVGWTELNHFIKRPLEILKIENTHGFATVSCNLNYVVWKNLNYRHKNETKVTYIRPFLRRYVEFEKIAYTNQGRYFFIKYNGQEIGWVSPKPLRRVHRLNKFSPLNAYFLKKMQKREKDEPVVYSTEIQDVELYGLLKNTSELTIWSAPEGSTGAESIPLSEEYLDIPYKIIEKNTVKKLENYKLVAPDNSVLGYTNAKNVALISEEEYRNRIIYMVPIDDEEVLLPKKDLLGQKVPELSKEYINIVNMGRLSPEKNQERLIEAFAKFKLVYPKSRLFILGKGPLAGDLKNKIVETNQEESVFLLGHISLPFRFIEKTDLFVLPSFYEGQPMVLLESLTLGMKILASNIPANINVIGINEEYGLLTTGTEVEDIYEGLIRSFKTEHHFKSFDYIEYNQKAINNFYEEINVE